MEPVSLESVRIEEENAAVAVLFLLIIIPCLLGFFGGASPAAIVGFILSTLVLQGFAPAAGIGLGFPVHLLLPFLVSVAAGVILLIFLVCDLFSGRSPWVMKHIGKVESIMEKHPVLKSYGEFVLLPIMWVPGLGLYGTPILAWILHWRSLRSVLLMLAGWLIACLVVLGTAEGILVIFS
jgi:hypothetical protein